MADTEKQMDAYYIPGWWGAPDWAKWLQFCKTRGWVFISEALPHIYSDGHVDLHGKKWKRACDIPGVEFLRNHRGYSGKARPLPE